MGERNTWAIIDLKNECAMYGFNKRTMLFSTREIAFEIAYQLFENTNGFILVQFEPK